MILWSVRGPSLFLGLWKVGFLSAKQKMYSRKLNPLEPLSLFVGWSTIRVLGLYRRFPSKRKTQFGWERWCTTANLHSHSFWYTENHHLKECVEKGWTVPVLPRLVMLNKANYRGYKGCTKKVVYGEGFVSRIVPRWNKWHCWGNSLCHLWGDEEMLQPWGMHQWSPEGRSLLEAWYILWCCQSCCP